MTWYKKASNNHQENKKREMFEIVTAVLFIFSNGNKRERYLTVQFSCLLTFQSGPLFLVTLYFQESFVARQTECHRARFQTLPFFSHFSLFFFNQPLLWKHKVPFITEYFERYKENGRACMCGLKKPPFILNGNELNRISLLPVNGRQLSTVHELEQGAWHWTGVDPQWR